MYISDISARNFAHIHIVRLYRIMPMGALNLTVNRID